MKSILRPALKFFLAFFVLYGLLTGVCLLPSVAGWLSRAYQKPTERILKSLLPKAYLQLRSDAGSPEVFRVEYAPRQQVATQMQQSGAEGSTSIAVQGNHTKVEFYNLFLTFFLLFIALMALSPLSLKSKLWKTVLGSAVFYLFTVFKMWLALLNTFNQPEIGIYQLGSFTSRLVSAAVSFLTLGVNLLFVLLLWTVLVFDKSNWEVFLKKAGFFNLK